ncbi:MAG: hypothetical protein QXQ91_04315 [Nanopusillaceae archaeon]
MTDKKIKLGSEETQTFFKWALRRSYLDTILLYTVIPREIVKEAEKIEEKLFNELSDAVAQVISKYTDASVFKLYNLIDRPRIRNVALVMYIMNNNIGVTLDLSHNSDRYIFKRACEEGALWTPCQAL